MNNLNLSDSQLSALLNMAGKKLGQDPAQLKSQLENGKLDNLLGGLDASTAQKVNGVLSNPKAVEALLGNEQVRSLLQSLGGNGTGK